MRRKKQIQAMQQELALLRQTIDSGKELAALATNTAQQLKKPSIKTVAVQLMRSPRFRRTALIVGGAAAVGTIGAVAARYRFYQTIVAQEVEKALKPVHAQLDDLQATVDAMAEAEGIEPEKDPQGEKAPPLRRSEQAKFKRAARAQHVLRCKLGTDTKCWLPLGANFAV